MKTFNSQYVHSNNSYDRILCEQSAEQKVAPNRFYKLCSENLPDGYLNKMEIVRALNGRRVKYLPYCIIIYSVQA